MAACGLPILLVAADTAEDADLDRFRAAVPQATVERLPGTGRDVCRDQPQQVVVLVGEWLARHAGLAQLRQSFQLTLIRP